MQDDWGFTQLLELAELADPAKGWVSDDGALTVEVLILPSAWAVRLGSTLFRCVWVLVLCLTHRSACSRTSRM